VRISLTKRDARRIAPDDEHGGARLAAGIVGDLRHRQQQIGLGPPVTKDLTPVTTNASPRRTAVVRGPSRASVKARAAVSRREHGQRKALALRAGRHAQEPRHRPGQAAQRALGVRDLLVERRQAYGSESAAAQLGGWASW